MNLAIVLQWLAMKAKRTTQTAKPFAAEELAIKICARCEVVQVAENAKDEKLHHEKKGLTPEIRGHYRAAVMFPLH